MSAPHPNRVAKDIRSSLSGNKSVECLVLFGSVARGDDRVGSDVDVCIVIRGRGKAAVSELMLDIEKRHNTSVNVVFTDSGFSGLDKYFIETLLREGVVLLGKMPPVPVSRLELEPYQILKYDLTGLSRPEKMKVKRLLYGMTTVKREGNKVYEFIKKGYIESAGGLRKGIASILVPQKESLRAEALLKGFGVRYRKISIWLSRP